MIEPLYRFLSAFDHLGRCRECGISWKYRDHMEPVAYAEDDDGIATSRAFPLCQQCFDELTVERVTSHFRKMWLYDWDRTPDIEAWNTFYLNTIDRKAAQTEVDR